MKKIPLPKGDVEKLQKNQREIIDELNNGSTVGEISNKYNIHPIVIFKFAASNKYKNSYEKQKTKNN